MEEIGVIIKQWDGLEVAGKPWEACLENCYVQGAMVTGRWSAMVIYQWMRDREDRQTIPLPFGDRSGVVIRNSEVSFDCMYLIDGATYQIHQSKVPGCKDNRCPVDGNGGIPYDRNGWACGLDATPYNPQDLRVWIETHAKHGAQWHGPGWHSGYNEVIIGARNLNAHLPHAIEAFFALSDGMADWDGFGISVRDAHRNFLRTYGLTSDQVPLLRLDQDNWEAPFALIETRVG